MDISFYVVPDDVLPHPMLLGRDILCRDDNRMLIEKGVLQIKAKPKYNIKVGTDLDEKDLRRVYELMDRYADRFAEDLSNIGRCTTAVMEIEVTSNTPVVGKRYQVPFAKQDVLSGILKDLLDNNIIRPSSSPHAASVVLVEKANGESRMCVDYRALNSVTIKKQFPMPVVEEQLAKLSGGVFFSILDMTAGYYQIPMDENSKKYTAFITHEGLFEHNVMPFGLVNAPMCFQEMVTRLIATLRHRKSIVSYVDEVIIATSTVEDGLIVLEEFMEAIKLAGLTVRPSKCNFMNNEVKFLGHIVSKEGIKPGNEKTEAIDMFPKPRNVSEVRQFLGLTGYFSKFVPNYSNIAEPLRRLLKKNSNFVWAEDQETAFKALKTVITEKPVLVLFDIKKEHEVHTDASCMGLSGMLLQNEDDGWKVVFYYSRRCNENEKNYASHELEVLAIVESLERFRMYLLGTSFRVITDCNAIVTTKAITPLPKRIARWWLKLQEFDFTCHHRPGIRMQHIDAMSRAPGLQPQETATVAENILAITNDSDEDWIFSMQLQDEKLRTIVEALKDKPRDDTKQIRHDYEIHSGRLYRKIEGQRRLVIPSAIRWRIARACHDEAGHFAVEKTLQRISKDFWFQHMRRYIKSYIEACPECCLNKVKGGKTEGQLHIVEILPIPFRAVNMDHLGPFIKSKKGNLHIIVLVCTFSKYTILKAVRNTKTTPVINMLLETMSVFGQPLRITTDRGTAFTSKEFEDFLNMHGIVHIKTAVRTPRANGQAERVNKTILSAIKCSKTNPKDWDAALTNIQWCINSQPNSTTKMSPNELVFSFNPRNMSENRIIQAMADEEFQNETETKKEIALANISTEKKKWKLRYDKKHQRPYIYKVGDLIVTDYVPTATGDSHKLDPKYKGPYIITKLLEYDRYLVEDLPDAPRSQRRYCNVLSSDHIKPWCRLSPEIDGHEDFNSTEDSSKEDEKSGEAELSKNNVIE